MATEFKLTANPPLPNEAFGGAVAVGLDTAVVGTPTGGFGPGAAYVFVQSGSGWTQQIRVSASDETWRDAFGAAVAIDGDDLVVGAPEGGDKDRPRVRLSPKRTVLERAGSTARGERRRERAPWILRCSVSISGDYIIVGADPPLTCFTAMERTGPSRRS